MGDETTRIYFGTDKVGRALRRTYDEIARQYYAGSVSAMLRDAANEKWGIDPETGELRAKLSPVLPTGSPKPQKGLSRKSTKRVDK